MERGKHLNGRFCPEVDSRTQPAQPRQPSGATPRSLWVVILVDTKLAAAPPLRSGSLLQGRSRKNIRLLGANAGEADFIYYPVYIIHPPPYLQPCPRVP